MKLIDPIKARVVNVSQPEPEAPKPVSKLERVIVNTLSGAIILAIIALLEAWPK